MWAGIDYGSKTAGTTVICAGKDVQKLQFYHTRKKQDADEFIFSMLGTIKPDFVCLDAPLSLPGILTNKQFSDYFYRQADKELKAMSPMFIGGLTARAIKLKQELWSKLHLEVFESYPGGLVRKLELNEHYKKRTKDPIPYFLDVLKETFGIQVHKDQIPDWHHVDALLCWITANRMAKKTALHFGNSQEGLIYL